MWLVDCVMYEVLRWLFMVEILGLSELLELCLICVFSMIWVLLKFSGCSVFIFIVFDRFCVERLVLGVL